MPPQKEDVTMARDAAAAAAEQEAAEHEAALEAAATQHSAAQAVETESMRAERAAMVGPSGNEGFLSVGHAKVRPNLLVYFLVLARSGRPCRASGEGSREVVDAVRLRF